MIPRSGRSTGERIGYPFQYSWASLVARLLVAQLVNNPPPMRETWVRSLGWEDSPGEGKGYPLQYSPLENSMEYSPWGHKESYMTEQLSLSLQVTLVVKNSLANAGDLRDTVSIPGLGRSPGEGHGNPLQFSCLENPLDKGACWATSMHSQGQTRLKQLTTLHTHLTCNTSVLICVVLVLKTL